jgi:hypothetical protein
MHGPVKGSGPMSELTSAKMYMERTTIPTTKGEIIYPKSKVVCMARAILLSIQGSFFLIYRARIAA